ncbi:GNAT family N-acetyltransferase [Streptacidiphilus sp. EB103A]|uniref:GNAT family N-acetyltransferase n=1 Tax=Streptacidiphilus sp. EB103A TaxID=3156275 RepID=UPI0035159BCE
MEFAPFDPSSASEADYEAITELRARMHAVDRPGTPPLSLMATVELMTSDDGMGPRTFWTAREADCLLGFATVMLPDRENTDMAMVFIEVDLDRRRQGIGTAFLRALLPSLQVSGRPRVLAVNITGGSDGEQFAEAMGLVCTYRNLLQTLEVESVDPALWDVSVPDGYRLYGWTHAVPEEFIVSYAEARKAIADAPSQDLAWEETDWTPQRVRDEEAVFAAAGQDYRIVVAVHEHSGEVVGITELFIRPGDPDHARQMDTAVRKEHRGHGLGRAIKAQMMRRLMADRPDLARVSTTTASDNVYMVAVNHSIGYADVRSLAYWETATDDLVARLGS